MFLGRPKDLFLRRLYICVSSIEVNGFKLCVKTHLLGSFVNTPLGPEAEFMHRHNLHQIKNKHIFILINKEQGCSLEYTKAKSVVQDNMPSILKFNFYIASR